MNSRQKFSLRRYEVYRYAVFGAFAHQCGRTAYVAEKVYVLDGGEWQPKFLAAVFAVLVFRAAYYVLAVERQIRRFVDYVE